MRRRLGAVLAASAVVLVAGCGADPVEVVPSTTVASSVEPSPTASPVPSTHTLQGTITVYELTQVETESEPCFPGAGLDGGAGYDDIRVGTGVTVRSGEGEIIATGALGESRVVEASPHEVTDYDALPPSPDMPEDAMDFEAWEAHRAEYAEWSDLAAETKKTVLWGACQFSFEVEVPDASFYSVEVSHRGAVNYSRADLEAAAWTLDLTL